LGIALTMEDIRILDFVNIWNVDWWKHCFVVWKEKRREPRQVVFRLPQLLFFINAISLQRSMKEELEKVGVITNRKGHPHTHTHLHTYIIIVVVVVARWRMPWIMWCWMLLWLCIWMW